MNLQEIKNFLQSLFSKPLGDGKGRHIVFWYDDNEEFIEDIDDVNLENVKLIKMTSNNAFYIKYYIEKEDTESNILIYSNMAKPLAEEDWLYDIYGYSEEFSTDRATVIMRELKVLDASLTKVFKDYNTFFRRKERIAAFKGLGIENYTEEKVHIGILAVLTKTRIMDMEEILKALIKDNLDETKKLYEDIEKFGSLDVLWMLIEKYYGYSFKERSFGRFMAILLVTNMNETIKFDLPKSYGSYISSKTTNCIVFVSHFMSSSKDAEYYDKMQKFVASKLKIAELLESKDSDEFKECDTFEAMDKLILIRITNLLEDGVEEYDKYLNLLNNRRTLNYYKKYISEYKALKWVINLLKKKKELGSIIKTESSKEFIKSYTKEYFFIDKAYRKFYYHFDKCEWKDDLMNLKNIVENIYNNWYLQELAIKWSDSMQKLDSWRIEGVKQQDRFYKDNIKFKGKERIFVIISDGLRYESAQELNTMLINERKCKSELDYVQGVLPSYTKLGMAALLPHKIIGINDKYDVLVDGINSNGTENRDKILKKENKTSMAITYDKVMDMNNTDIRKAFVGMDVVYIYHNIIDAVGDHASTEREVFEATDTAFNEIIDLVNRLVDRVSASNIFITADHGYLYKRSPMEESNKISGVKLEDGEDNRRFLLTTSNEKVEGTISFSMDYVLGDNSGKYVTTPKGATRFKVQGAGANYVHGGAMPQEIIVPVIKFKNDRSKSSVNDTRTVTISLTSITRKITNIITYLEFFQDEMIQDKVISKQVRCYFEDEDGNKISNENIIIGDSRSENPKERTYREKFVLKSMAYDKTKQYFLVIQDDEDAEGDYERIPFNIDIAIVDEFGF